MALPPLSGKTFWLLRPIVFCADGCGWQAPFLVRQAGSSVRRCEWGLCRQMKSDEAEMSDLDVWSYTTGSIIHALSQKGVPLEKFTRNAETGHVMENDVFDVL